MMLCQEPKQTRSETASHAPGLARLARADPLKRKKAPSARNREQRSKPKPHSRTLPAAKEAGKGIDLAACFFSAA